MSNIVPVQGTHFNIPAASYISAATMTGTTAVAGPWINISNFKTVAFQAAWTGTPTGTFAINVSADLDPTGSPVLGATALTLPSSPSPNPAGAAGSWVFFLSGLSTPWVQLVYTNASSTGTLNVGASGTT